MERGLLYQLWDMYLGIPRDLPTERIHELKEQKLKKLLDQLLDILPRFSDQLHELVDIHSVSNVLALEFMSEVKSMCGENLAENFSTVVDFVSRGRGALMVMILSMIGIRDLVHGLNFGKWLLTLLKQFISCTSLSWPQNFHDIHLADLEAFVVREPRYRKLPKKDLEETLKAKDEPDSGETSDTELSYLPLEARFRSRRRPSAHLRKQQSRTKENDDSGSETSRKLLVVFREMRRTFRNIPDLIENQVDRVKSNVSPKQISDPLEVEFDSVELDPLELCLLLTSILKDICFDDDQYREEKSTCMHLLPLFEELQNCLIDQLYDPCQAASVDSCRSRCLTTIGRCHLRIFVVLISKICSQIDGLLVLRNNQTPNSILGKMCKHLNGDVMWIENSNDKFLLLFDIVSSCLLYSEVVLSSVGLTPLRLGSALDATEFVLHGFGLELLEIVLLNLDEESADEQSSIPVEHVVAQLMCSLERIVKLLKLLRARYIHLLTCTKRVHRQCSTFMTYAHHHDVLGLSDALTDVGSSGGRVTPNVCVIAEVSRVLLNVFEKSHESTKHQILSALSACGLCCCIPVEFFTKSLLKGLETSSVELRTTVLETVISSFLNDFGGAIKESHDLSCDLSTTVRCTTCTEEVSEPSTIHIRASPSCKMDTSDSALSDSDSQGGLGLTLSSRWRCLKLLLPHLSSADDVVAVHVRKQLLRLVEKSCDFLRYELLYFIFLPVLQEAERILFPSVPEDDPMNEVHGQIVLQNDRMTTTRFCLCVVPRLLSATSSRELFIASDGVSLLENLVAEDRVRSCALHVLQRLTYLRDLKPEANDSEPATEFQCHSLPTFHLQMSANLNSVSTAALTSLSKLLFQDLQGELFTSQCVTIKKLGQLSDVWNAARVIFADNEVFRNMFVANSGPVVARSLVFAGVKALLHLDVPPSVANLRLNVADDCRGVSEKHLEIQRWFVLVRAALRICLFCARNGIKFDLQVQTVDEFLDSVHEIVHSEVMNDVRVCGALQFLCHLLFSVISDRKTANKGDDDFLYQCLENSSFDRETSGSNRERSPSFGHVTSDNYEADYESSLDTNSDNENVSRLSLAFPVANADRDKTTYPELCRLVLNIVTNCITFPPANKKSTKSATTNAATTTVASNLNLIDKNQESSQPSDSCQTDKISEMAGESRIHVLSDAGEVNPCECRDAENVSARDMASEKPFGQDEKSSSKPVCDAAADDYDDDEDDRDNETGSCVGLHVLRRLAAFGKTFASVVMFVHDQNLIKQFISCYKTSRCSDETLNRDVLRVLLELFLHVSEIGLSPGSLTSFLSLFNDGENLDLLLSTLFSISSRLPVQPKYSLKMPVSMPSSPTDEMKLLSPISDDGVSSPDSIQKSYSRMTSVVSQSSMIDEEGFAVGAALKVGLRDVVSPLGRKDGRLSVAFWIMVEDCQKINLHRRRKRMRSAEHRTKGGSESPNHRGVTASSDLHVLSVGNSELLLQVWLKGKGKALGFKMTSAAGEFGSVPNEVFLPVNIRKNDWCHLVLTCEQISNKNRNETKITVHLDGLNENAVSMKWLSPEGSTFKSTTSPFLLCLGHCVDSRCEEEKVIRYQLGNLFLFQDLLLSKWMSYYLYCLGPDCLTLDQCDSSDLNPTFSLQSWALVLNNVKPSQDSESTSLATMRSSLVLTYSPSHPDIVSLTDVKPKKGGVLHSLLSDFTSQPTLIRVRSVSELSLLVHQETIATIRQLGGIRVFLYLFAKVVECSSKESDQSKALSIVFHLIQRDKIMMQEFLEIDGFSMIVKVFLTIPCVIGFHTLKVLLDASVTAPLLSIDRFSRDLDVDTCSLVRDVRIVTDILLVWTVWNRAADDVCLLGFKAIDLLVRPTHPGREFNVRALLAAGAIEKLFNICLERLQSSYPSLSFPLCEVFLSIVRNLIGIHPEIHHILQICDFLLLTHPAANTFVFHNPTTFCFRNKWISGDRPSTIPYEGSSVIVSDSNSSNNWKAHEYSKRSPAAELSSELTSIASESSIRKATPELSAESVPLGNGVAKNDKRAGSFKNEKIVDDTSTKSQNNCLVNGDVLSVLQNAVVTGDDGKISVVCGPNSELEISHKLESASVVGDQTETLKTVGSLVSPGGDNPGKEPPCGAKVGSLDSQDGEESTEVFQREVICGRISPVKSPPFSGVEEPSSEDQAQDPERKSIDSKDFCPLLRENSSTPTQSSVGTEKFGEVDAEICDSLILDAVDTDDEGLTRIVMGLLELMIDLLPSLPSEDLGRIFGVMITPQILVVLAHHRISKIRVAVLKMVRCFLRLCSSNQKESFIKLQIFPLLANQIHQHNVDQPIIEECISILLDHSTQLDQMAEMELPIGLPVLYQGCANLLLAVTEKSVSDPSLCHRLLLALQKIFVRILDVSQLMLECGLAEVLCNVIHTIGIIWYQDQVAVTRIDEPSNRQTTMDDVRKMFCLIAEKTFCTAGSSYYQQFEETFVLLKCLETRLRSLHGKDSFVVAFSVSVQCDYLQTILEYLVQVSATSHESPFTLDAIQSTASASFHNWVKTFDLLLNSGELSERFRKLIVTATDFILFRDANNEQNDSWDSSQVCDSNTNVSDASGSREGVSIEENMSVSTSKTLARVLLVFLMQALEMAAKKGKRTTITHLMSQTTDVLRVQLSRLLLYLLSPSAGLDQSLFAIETFNQKPANMDILKSILGISDTELKLKYSAYFLITTNINILARSQRNQLGEFIERMSLCKVEVIRPGAELTAERKEGMRKEIDKWSKKSMSDRTEWLKKEGFAFQRVLHRLDGQLKRLSSRAMEFTQTVNNDQNRLRKKFIAHVKRQMADRLQVKKEWQQLIAQLTHERAIWHCAKSYPCSWQLDPTEGPSRQRRKMNRCHLKMDKRFLLPERQYKTEAVMHKPPLMYLFHDDKLSLDSAAVIYKLHTSENIEHTCMCRHITPQATTSGVLLMGQTVVYYVADDAVLEDNYTQALLGNSDNLFMTLPHDDIVEFYKQWYLLKDEALEIFLSNGKTCFLALNSTQDRDELYNKLVALDLPNVQLCSNLQHLQMQWLEGSMTNFEYLMHLNKLAGRSFNDLMQYPVFPFILAQYTESYLDLERPSTFRDLSKTISTQFKEQEQKYVQLYQVLLEQKQFSDVPPDILLEPYHYTNHYSNVATVLQFLVRLPPFARMFVDFQDGSFDCADRMFHSIQTSYDLVTRLSITDSKELIPEFFYLPEFLENSEGFKFGVRQNGRNVSDVELPPWSQKDARLFTLIHRQALESEHVTRTLASWIDLVFGFKQQGKAALEAVNVFRPLMYFGIDVDAIEDELTRKAVKTMIQTHGQTPKQLFKVPHPSPQIKPRPATIRNRPSPLPQISGLRWGNYVGSPDCPNPIIVHCEDWKVEVTNLIALPTGEVFGLGSNSCFLVKQRGTRSMQPVGLSWAAVLSWRHRDGIIRLKKDQRQAPVNFLHWNRANQVTCAASLTNCNQIFFGTELGSIVVLNTKYNASKPSHLQVFDHRLQLFGHRDSVSCLSVCQPFSILVSASLDSTCIIWDLNKLCYVRSITHHKGSIMLLCVSNNSGDIASISNTDDGGSCLMIHTVNARFIACDKCPDRIMCIAFSPCAEGSSVNVIAGGLNTGRIRLWSTWDLSPIREMVPNKFQSPVLSIAYSPDAQSLFSLTRGSLTVWGMKTRNSRVKPFNFIPLS